MKRALALAAMLALQLYGTACADRQDDISSTDSYALGDALPGTNGTDFAEAKAAFNTSENAARSSEGWNAKSNASSVRERLK